MITAKEIVDMAIKQSGGTWKPSPGYVYPMIWKLLDKGLISEVDNGRYSLTKKGMKLLSDIDWVYKQTCLSRVHNNIFHVRFV